MGPAALEGSCSHLRYAACMRDETLKKMMVRNAPSCKDWLKCG